MGVASLWVDGGAVGVASLWEGSIVSGGVGVVRDCQLSLMESPRPFLEGLPSDEHLESDTVELTAAGIGASRIVRSYSTKKTTHRTLHIYLVHKRTLDTKEHTMNYLLHEDYFPNVLDIRGEG